MAQPRGKRAKSEARPALASALLSTLRFISVAQKENGTPFQTHIRLAHGTAVAFDGIIAAGQRIAEDLTACPHSASLINALARCKESLSIVQLDNARLSIKSDKFAATVLCLPSDALAPVEPDMPIAAIDDRIKAGFAAVSFLVSDSSEHVATASVLLQSGSIVGTNRHVLLEYWHGIDLPPGLVIPKLALNAIAKIDSPMKQFGYSERSATFWFEDGSWLKTQLYQGEYPNVSSILDRQVNNWPISPMFYTGVDAVLPFAKNNEVFFLNNMLSSHDNVGVGANYEVEGIPQGLCFNGKYLKAIEPFIKTVDFVGRNGIAYFFGDNIRGAICGIRQQG